MIAYWLLFAISAVPALSEIARDPTKRRPLASLFLVWLILTLAIGFRFEVGGDWFNYERIFHSGRGFSFERLLLRGDPGYQALNWWAGQLGYGTVVPNLVCGAVFAWGLLAFARRQPRPWLALTVAVPYLVIVVAMGYSRQGVAIGLAMLALSALGQNSRLRFALWIAVAALFHKTAVLLVPVVVLSSTRGRVWTAIWGSGFFVLLYFLLLADSVESLVENYLEAGYQSQGAAIRVAMNALPAAIFLAYRKYFNLQDNERSLWTYLSLGSVGFILLLIISPSSTAVDRLALYFIPVQVFVWSRLPEAFKARYGSGRPTQVGVVVYSALVLFVWLNFAAHSEYWLPYRSYLLEGF